MYLALFLGLLLNLGNLLSLSAGSRNLHTEDDVPLKKQALNLRFKIINMV
jgi:hypothetical protein